MPQPAYVQSRKRMKAEILWSPRAELDLEEIYAFLGIANEALAERLLRMVIERVGKLSEFPRMGVRRADLLPSARALVVGPYLVLYQTEPPSEEGPVRHVHVVRVLDARRNLQSLAFTLQ